MDTSLQNLSVSNLERTSKNWDKRTTDVLVAFGGYGNMFGGSGKLVHLRIHGDNSMTETGTIDIKGVAIYSSNIARGENGPSSSICQYYTGATSFDDLSSKEASYTIKTEGTCGGYDDALSSILSAKKEWFIN